MAADDVFGDSSLFEEFEKEREASSSFICYEKDEQGSEDRSRIVFQFSDSSSSESDSEDELKPKVQEQSVALTVNRLNKQNGQTDRNGSLQSDGSSDTDEPYSEPFIGQERQDKSTIFKLTHERNKFKRFCNIIDSTRFSHNEESSAVQILFQNNPFSRKHRVEIEDFVRHLLEKDRHAGWQTLQKLDIKASVPSCTDLNDKIPGGKRTERLRQSHVILGCSQFYHEYMLDTLGWPMVEYNPSLTDSWEIPVYELVFTDTLPIDEEVVKAKAKKMEKERMGRSKPKCWNCGGDHMLQNCKEPRNQQKINESRQEMMAQQKQQSGPPKSQRYHKEKSVDPKFERYRPGQLSDQLREALGLYESQIPSYIYKMRALGYPPGWMEEAKSAPVLSMFDENGEDADNEEAEADGIDPEKIIEYPGFTVELPSNVTDEADQYGLPPIQPHQLKRTLMASLQDQQQVQKRAQKESEDQDRKRVKLDSVDMDVDDGSNSMSFDPPLPIETPPSKPPPPDSTPPSTPKERQAKQSRLSLSREASQGRSDSPTLAELESQYQMLQKTLQCEDGDIEDGELIILDSADDDSQESTQSADQSLIEIDDSIDEGKTPIILTDDSIDEVDITDETKSKLVRNISTTSIQTFGELGTGSPGSSVPGTPSHNPFQDIKPSFKGTLSVSKDYGTPVLNRSGSFTALPQDNKFSQGIEEHIPFENLPEATGTFDKMRKLISKIRDKVPSRKKKS